MPRTYVLFLDNTPPTRSRLQFIPPPEEEGEFLLWYVKIIIHVNIVINISYLLYNFIFLLKHCPINSIL